jgi:hypothetical protein
MAWPGKFDIPKVIRVREVSISQSYLIYSQKGLTIDLTLTKSDTLA